MLESNGRLRAEIGAPLNWNIDLLLKKGVLPGAVAKSMNVNFTTDTPGLEDFNGGAWSKAEWQTLNGIQLGEIKEHTNFKVLYDKKNIYFAFETDLPAERKHKNMGRDGNAWLQDCLEIMIDPYGMREVSMHYVFNPLPNSCYEGAMGLITDVLHPKYGKEDVSWNGPWTYSTKRQNGKWYALVSIPFEGLGVPAPANGTVWTMNVARQAYWSPEMKWEGELSLWSPNLENMSINGNLNSFGEIRFK